MAARSTQPLIEAPGGKNEFLALAPDERLRFLAEHTFDLISEVDAKGKYIYVSPNHLQALGYTSDELLGSLVLEKIHPDDVERIGALWPVIVANQHGRLDFRFQHKD